MQSRDKQIKATWTYVKDWSTCYFQTMSNVISFSYQLQVTQQMCLQSISQLPQFASTVTLLDIIRYNEKKKVYKVITFFGNIEASN